MSRVALYTVRLCLLSMVITQSCVYYNTFFSARKYFEKGIKAKEKSTDGTAPPNAVNSFEDSIEKCLIVIRDYPESNHVDDAILLMGKALYEKGALHEAVKTLTSLLDNYPDTELVPEAMFYLGMSYLELENYDNATTQFQRLLSEHAEFSEDKGVLFKMAETQVRLERYEDAVGNLKLIIEDGHDRSVRDRAVFLLAQSQFHLGRYEEAMQSFTELTENTGSIALRTESYFWLVSSFSKAGDHAMAISTLRELMGTNLSPDDLMKAEEILAEELYLTGNVEDALEEYKKLARGFPETETAAKAWYHCGLIELEERNDLPEAKKHFMSAYKESKNSEYGQKARLMSVELTRYSRLEKILGSGDVEKEPVARFLKAEFLLLQMKKAELALEEYSGVVEKHPDSKWSPKAAYAVALILDEMLGDTISAQAAYRDLIARYDSTRYADYARIMLGLEIEPKEKSFYADELEAEEMISEYFVREDDLFRYDDTSTDTTSGTESDSTSQEEDEEEEGGE